MVLTPFGHTRLGLEVGYMQGGYMTCRYTPFGHIRLGLECMAMAHGYMQGGYMVYGIWYMVYGQTIWAHQVRARVRARIRARARARDRVRPRHALRYMAYGIWPWHRSGARAGLRVRIGVRGMLVGSWCRL